MDKNLPPPRSAITLEVIVAIAHPETHQHCTTLGIHFYLNLVNH
ncbi:MAG TPA: hypothetical protein V6D12_10955 [Candidatus Obscuribacterales bacterium]